MTPRRDGGFYISLLREFLYIRKQQASFSLSIRNQVRKYQRIWEELKLTKKASIVAPVETHTKIINAVRKEKTKDLGWKLILGEQSIRYRMLDTSNDKILTFILKDISPVNSDNL